MMPVNYGYRYLLYTFDQNYGRKSVMIRIIDSFACHIDLFTNNDPPRMDCSLLETDINRRTGGDIC